MKDSVKLLIKDPKRTIRKRVPFEASAKEPLYNWYAATHQHGGAIEHGYLYNWWAATNGRNIAAINAHVPSNAEHAALSTDLGGNTVAGGHLKEAGIVLWQTPNTGADNSSGYTALPSGHRTEEGVFTGIRITAYLWTSDYSFQDYEEAYDSRLEYNLATFEQGLYGQPKKCGETLKLIVDEPIEINGSDAIYVGNDGRRYKCILIGSIWYMAENLAETKYRNGELITKVIDNSAWAALNSEGYCAYNNDEANAFSEFIADIAPAGSHVPTQSEWSNIHSAIRTGSPSPYTSDAGIRMKAAETWTSSNWTGDNSSGFKAFGSGVREYTGLFFGKGERSQFWASDPSGSYGYVRGLEYDRPDLTYDNTVSKKYGSSVRCIKDSTILEEGQTGTLTDVDGHIYQTKCIGGIEIMLSNLRVEHYNDGTPIPNIKYDEAWSADVDGAMCYYDSTPAVEEIAGVDPSTLTWEEYEITEKYFKVATSLQRWYFGTDSLYTGFTRKVYNTDGETEITDGVYHDGYYVGLTPVDENVGEYERNFSIEIADWKNQTLATASGSQPAGAGAEAGPYQRIHSTLGARMAAVPSRGTGTWTFLTGMGTATIYDIHSATTEIRASAYGEYDFRWTEVWDGGSDSDQVTILFDPL
jgi:uncharacterized protein (TIGR02145 family)